jgi:toxin-antitoxin system PIN domain toxin
MGADRCVVDTNVLVYATVAGNPWHVAARRWIDELAASTELCVTPQIAREYLVVLTRGRIFERAFSAGDALDALTLVLEHMHMLDESAVSVNLLRELVRQYDVRGKSVHDCNLVAVALAAGVSRLATFNGQDFARFAEIVMEPEPDVAL